MEQAVVVLGASRRLDGVPVHHIDRVGLLGMASPTVAIAVSVARVAKSSSSSLGRRIREEGRINLYYGSIDAADGGGGHPLPVSDHREINGLADDAVFYRRRLMGRAEAPRTDEAKTWAWGRVVGATVNVVGAARQMGFVDGRAH